MTDGEDYSVHEEHNTNDGADDAREKELQLIRREHELSRRELLLTRRELDLLRGSSATPIIQQPSSHPNIHAVKDLLNEFQGSGDDHRRCRG